jgi:hypothetical protein
MRIIAAVRGALCAIPAAAAAQHEHHRVTPLFASYAVGGAPREDAPVRTQSPGRIF